MLIVRSVSHVIITVYMYVFIIWFTNVCIGQNQALQCTYFTVCYNKGAFKIFTKMFR